MDGDDLFQGVLGLAHTIVQTDGQGRIVARAGEGAHDDDVAVRLDLLLDAARQLGARWEGGGCELAMLTFVDRILVLAALPDGGAVGVVAPRDVAPGLLLSHVRRLLDMWPARLAQTG